MRMFVNTVARGTRSQTITLSGGHGDNPTLNVMPSCSAEYPPCSAPRASRTASLGAMRRQPYNIVTGAAK